MSLDSWQARERAPGWRHRGNRLALCWSSQLTGRLLTQWWNIFLSLKILCGSSSCSLLGGYLVSWFSVSFRTSLCCLWCWARQFASVFMSNLGPNHSSHLWIYSFAITAPRVKTVQTPEGPTSTEMNVPISSPLPLLHYYILQVCFEVCCAGFRNKLFTGHMFANHEICIVELPPLPFKVYELDGCTPLWWMKTVISKM